MGWFNILKTLITTERSVVWGAGWGCGGKAAGLFLFFFLFCADPTIHIISCENNVIRLVYIKSGAEETPSIQVKGR